MINFKYKNNEYIIFFYPCGFMARVKKKKTNKTREFKYNKNTTIKTFLYILDKLQF